MTSSFTDLGIPESIVKAMNEMGWTEPTPVQVEAIPMGMSGYDMFAQAQTGTGKTGTYGSIVLGRTKSGCKSPSILTLVPTRELANQVAEEIDKLSIYTGHKTVAVYGGVSIENQIKKLRKGVDMIIATPGRLKDIMNRNEADLSKISIVVLDEADRMLDMGFSRDLDFILGRVPSKRQTLMFSATMSPEIKKLTDHQMKDHKEILVSKDEPTVELIKQYYVMTTKDTKLDELCNILDTRNPKTIVFCHTKRRVDQLTKKLTAANYYVSAIHGDVPQNRREKAIKNFKDGTINVLVATDVAARGLDIKDVDCAINYDMPTDPETYVHRIGRTGRAGKSGIAVTFVLGEEKGDMKGIERQVDKKIPVLDMSAFDDIDNAVPTPVVEQPVAVQATRPNMRSPSTRPTVRPSVRAASEPRTDNRRSSRNTRDDDKVSMEICLGRVDGIEKSELCEFIKKKGSLRSIDIGRITLNENKSFVEIDKDKADLAVCYLSKCSYEGKPLQVRMMPTKMATTQ
jgi:ATP-dependent RNA helicase DeaD